MADDYKKGFIEKCAEQGITEEMLKEANWLQAIGRGAKRLGLRGARRAGELATNVATPMKGTVGEGLFDRGFRLNQYADDALSGLARRQGYADRIADLRSRGLNAGGYEDMLSGLDRGFLSDRNVGRAAVGLPALLGLSALGRSDAGAYDAQPTVMNQYGEEFNPVGMGINQEMYVNPYTQGYYG